MKRRFMIYLLLVIVFSSGSVALTLGLYGHRSMEEILEDQKEDLYASIRNAFISFDQILSLIERPMRDHAEQAVLEIAKKVTNRRGELLDREFEPRDLQALARDHGVSQVYLIDRNGRVVNSSLQDDIGLDLFGLSPNFEKFLRSVYGRGEVVSNRITIGVNTGRMNIFTYYSPEGADYIVETSSEVRSFVNSQYGPKYYDFIFKDQFLNLKQGNRYLKDLNIYISGSDPKSCWSIMNQGERFEEDFDIILKVNEEGEVRFDKGDRSVIYTSFKLADVNFQFTNKLFIKLIYDFAPLHQFSRNTAIFASICCIGIIILGFLISSRIFNKAILRRIAGIHSSLDRIAGGQYEDRVSVGGDDELTRIAENIERMKENIVSREERLLASEEELKERTRQLERARDELEMRVQERTADLTETNRLLSQKIEERKRMEEELLKARKLESVGVLAGGIAHDFNNLLTGILGNITLAGLYLEDREEARRLLASGEDAALRAKDLTNRFLTFSKGGSPIRAPASLAEVLKATVEMSLSGSNVRPVFAIDEDLQTVEIDTGQITQVINSLVQNALEAMPSGGTLEIHAADIHISPDDPNPDFPLQPGYYARVSIKDHGRGIPAEDLPRVFDPYFSTKERGAQKGMGLGLATAYSIIRAHDGHIAIDSVEGEGTTVRFVIPAMRPAESGETEPSGAGKLRVLVMDDEEVVRDICSRMLRYMGHEVILAQDGEQAIDLYGKEMESGRPFDVVILDLTVPGGIGGREVIQRLRELDQGVRSIVSTGYAHDAVVTRYREYGFLSVASKPYSMEGLQAALREAMKS